MIPDPVTAKGARAFPVAIWVVAACALSWGAVLLFSSASGRVLYGDGAWYVLQHLITPHRFNDYDFQRTFASLLSQAPVLFGQRLGLETVASYAALYSFGIFVVPAIAMVAALVLSRHQPVMFAANALAILVYGFGTNFINTEANLLFGLAWLSVTILARDGPAPVLRGLVLPALAIALLRAYEGMLLVGPLLALWAVLAAARGASPRESAGLTIAALLFLLGGVIGLGGFVAPRDPSNASRFQEAAFSYLRGPHLWLLLAGLAAVPGICMRWRRLRIVSAVASLAFGLAFVAGILGLTGFYGFSVYYQNRSFMVLLLPVLVGALLAAYWRRPAWFAPSADRSGYAIFLLPFACALAGDAIGTHRWNIYVQAFCEVLDRPVLPAERIALLSNSGAQTAWGWTHPTMSVLLRDRGSQAMVVNEPGAFSWEPFDPAKAVSISERGLCQAPFFGTARPDSFELPMSFAKGAYPSWVSSVSGLSKPEGWATWSEGPEVQFHLARALPQDFDLRLRIGSAFGSNRTLPIKVRAGGRELEFVADREPTEVVLEFRGVENASVLSFTIPKPESPSAQGAGGDPRKLGIAFTSLAVIPK